MKIAVTERSVKEIEKSENRAAFEIEIDGESVFFASDGEPEDSTLYRDFNDIYKIPDILVRVYNAARNGEELEITFLESDDI